MVQDGVLSLPTWFSRDLIDDVLSSVCVTLVLLLLFSFPPQPFFFFFFTTDYMIPHTFTVTSEHILFYFLVFFSVLHFLVVVSVR